MNSDLELLDFIVNNFVCFNDVSSYKNRKIYFYKRANLLVRDYYQLIPTIRNNIKSLNNLLPCADYVIPRFLRDKKVLVYTEALDEMISEKQLILPESEYEIEIRANMIWCIYIMQQELKKIGKYFDLITLDHIVWNLGKLEKPKTNNHRTLTTFY